MKTSVTVRTAYPTCPLCHTKQTVWYHNDEPHIAAYFSCYNYPGCEGSFKMVYFSYGDSKNIRFDWFRGSDNCNIITTEFIEHKG